MINILRNGASKTLEFKCSTCGCVFEADINSYVLTGEEIVRESYDGAHKVVVYAPYTMSKCPCCGRVALYIRRFTKHESNTLYNALP